MINKLVRLLFLILTGSSIKAHDLILEIKDLGHSIQSYTLITPNSICVSSLTVTPGNSLAIFDSPTFDAIDKSTMPIEVLHLIPIVKAIKAKYDLAEVAIVGDLYVPSEYRGKGHARSLLTKTCTQAFSKGFKAIVLVPDPFEYKNGKQNLLADQIKKEQLIRLYQTCGFKKATKAGILFMYRDC